jgi:ribose 5-phosphate isomerase B
MIFLGSDHRGFFLKQKLKELLTLNDYPFCDLGPNDYDQNDDYPLVAFKVGEEVINKNENLGILICKSGIGMCLAANKVSGIRAGQIFSEKQALSAREDDNLNVICLSSEFVTEDDNLKAALAFLNAKFGGEERHLRRLNLIKNYESQKR